MDKDDQAKVLLAVLAVNDDTISDKNTINMLREVNKNKDIVIKPDNLPYMFYDTIGGPTARALVKKQKP